MINFRMPPMIFRDYVLVKKSTLVLVTALAAGMVAKHYYCHHKKELDAAGDQLQEMAEKGKDKAGKIVEELKSK